MLNPLIPPAFTVFKSDFPYNSTAGICYCI